MPETSETKIQDRAKHVEEMTIQLVVGTLPFMERNAPVEWLADFYCCVTSGREEIPYSRYVHWHGEFRSVNCATGEVLQSRNAIFPNITSGVINPNVILSKWDRGNRVRRKYVTLAFRVGREPDWGIDEDGNPQPNNVTGYRYVTRDIHT